MIKKKNPPTPPKRKKHEVLHKMPSQGSQQHMNLIQQIVNELREKGYNIVNCNGVMPDAIATKDNKLYAVEALIVPYSCKDFGWKNMNIVEQKRKRYSMFDDVLFAVETRDKRKDHVKIKEEKKKHNEISEAETIVNEFILELQEKGV